MRDIGKNRVGLFLRNRGFRGGRLGADGYAKDGAAVPYLVRRPVAKT
jgi:hypothetical protein